MEPEDFLIMGDEKLSTIPEKESDEVIKSSVKDLVPIPSESEDTSDNDSECDLPFCDNYVTSSTPLFYSNNDFTSSDDESLPEKDVQEENFKIYSNPLFEFDTEYIIENINQIHASLLFYDVIRGLESKGSFENFQDNPDDEEDVRSIQEYMNDLKEEYQVRALLANSKRFFKKGTQRFSGAKATDQTECHKCGSKGKNKGLIAETYEWDEEEVSSDEETEVKALMTLHVKTEILKENQNLRNELKELTSITETWLNSSNKIPPVSRPKDLIFIKSSADNSNMSITTCNKPRLSKAKNSTLPNHDTDKVPSDESERNMTDHSVDVSDSLVTDYDQLMNLYVIIDEPSSAPAKDNISISVSKTNSAPASKLKDVKIEDDPPLDIVMKELNELKLQIIKNKIISLRKEIKPRNPEHVTKNCETCGSNVHTITDHKDIEWFRKREALQAKKAETLKTSKIELSRSKTPTKRWVSKQN
ncbi:hypothetical protein Tco_0624774 [Tanacetum coccineum]|uniref:Uncharacterized protein n=1 Tax=Tanacetum coccineum TaxID=301880 RepID=A0ABQ4WEW6_9ASTR